MSKHTTDDLLTQMATDARNGENAHLPERLSQRRKPDGQPAQEGTSKKAKATQDAWLKMYKARLSEETKQRAELSRKVRSLSAMQPVLKKCQQDCQDERVARLVLVKELELIRAELARSKAEKAEMMKVRIVRENALEEESARREDAARRELIRAKDEAKKQIIRLEGEKERAVEDYHSSNGYREEILLAKREAYAEGLRASVRIFNHYGCVDLEKYAAGHKDPVLRASAPPDEYATQWAYLEDEGEAEGDDFSQTAPGERRKNHTLAATPLAEMIPAEPEAATGREAPKVSRP